MKKTTSFRLAYLIAFICVVALLGFASYLQMHDGVTPCALCIMQRICMAALGFTFFLGAAFSINRWGNIFIGSLSFFIAISGEILAGRQTWIQHVPTGITGNCDVSLNYMLKVMPFTDVMKKVLEGGAECSQVTWQFLSMSLAEWSMMCFGFFALFSLWQLWRNLQIFR
jgi:disulfide bond formation protein DsbB